MATIYAKTGSQYIFTTRSWNDPDTWQGGIIPTASDTVIIAGETVGNASYPGFNGYTYRQGANRGNFGMSYWKGQINLVTYAGSGSVTSQTGSLFSYTTEGELIKFDYSGAVKYPGFPYRVPGIVDSVYNDTFLNVSVDTSFSPWTSQYWPGTGSDGYAGFIYNIYSTFFVPSGVIRLTGSETASFDTLIIHSGSKVHLSDNAQLNIYNKVYLYRGELKTSGSCMLNFSKPYTGSAGAAVSNDNELQFISVLNDAGSKFSMEGPEVRTNNTLSLSASIGDSYISVGSTTGFAEGDHIFVGEKDIEIIETSGSPYYRPAQTSPVIPSMDEAFIVAATGSGRLYVGRVAALDAPVVFTASATEIIVDDERYGVGDKIIVNGQTASITTIEDYTYQLKDYDFSGSMTQNDLQNEFYVNADEGNNYANPFPSNWKILPGKGLFLDSFFPNQDWAGFYLSTDYSSWNPARLFVRDVYERNTKVEVWMNNNFLVEDTGSIFKNTELQTFSTQSTAFVFMQVDPTKRLYGIWTDDFSCGLRTTFYRNKGEQQPLNPSFYFKPQRGRNAPNPSIHLPKVDPNYIYDTHKYTIDYYKGEYQVYFDDRLVETRGDLTLGPSKGLVGVGLWPSTINNRYTNWTVITRMRVSVTKQKLTLSNAVTGVTPGQKVYQSGVEYPHAAGNQVIKLQSFITDPLDFDNLFYTHRGYSDFAGDGKTPVLRYWYDNFDADLTNGTVKNKIQYDPSDGGSRIYSPWILGQAMPWYQASMATSYNNRRERPHVAVLDLGEERTFNTVGWLDQFGGGSSYNIGIKYTTPIEISGSNDLTNWTPITASVDNRDGLTWQYFRDFSFPSQTFRYIVIKVPTNNNVNQNWRIQGLRVLNNQSNRIQVNNASDFNIGDVVAINNQSTGWSDYYLYGYTSNMYPYIQAGSGSNDVLGDLKGREYTITDKTGNIITLDRSFRHGYLMKGDSVVKVNRATEIRGSYESGSWSTGRLYANYNAIGNTYDYAGRADTEFRLVNVGLRNFSNMFPQRTGQNGLGYPIWMPGAPSSRGYRLLGVSYYGGPPDNYSPWVRNTDNYQVRHSYMGLFAGELGFSYEGRGRGSNIAGNNAGAVTFKYLPKISTGNIGWFNVNTYNTLVRVIQAYNWFYNTGVVYNPGTNYNLPSNIRTAPFRHLLNKRNKATGARGGGHDVAYRPDGAPTSYYVQRRGVTDVTDNQITGLSAYNSILFNDQGTYQGPIYPVKNMLFENKYLHLQSNSLYSGNPLFESGNPPYTFGSEYAVGRPLNVFQNFNHWGVDYYRTLGYLIRKKHSEDFYRFYAHYLNNYTTYQDFFNWYVGQTAINSFCGARISSLSPTTSSFTVSFTYRADEGIKNSSFVGMGDLTGSWTDAITTLEDTNMVYRSQYDQNLFQNWYLTRSTRLSGYAYLVYIRDEVVEYFEALPPNTDFTNITRTFDFSGETDIHVYFIGSSLIGYYDIKNISSVLETYDPENVVIRHNTFDEQTLFGTSKTNTDFYKHQIKDLTKAGKFRLKSARLG